MKRRTPPAVCLSKVSVKSLTVIPREVCEQLGLKPGDMLRYRATDEGMLLEGTSERGPRSVRDVL